MMKWKKVLAIGLTAVMLSGSAAVITGCGSAEETAETAKTEVSETEKEETEKEETVVDETAGGETASMEEGEEGIPENAEGQAGDEAAAAEAESESAAEETVVADEAEEIAEEETETEMVDFETWAKQEDNDDICYVVWNEKTKVQKVIKDPEEKYIVQEGDRIAVPYRKGVRSVYYGDVSQTDIVRQDYIPVTVEGDKWLPLTITWDTEDGYEYVSFPIKGIGNSGESQE